MHQPWLIFFMTCRFSREDTFYAASFAQKQFSPSGCHGAHCSVYLTKPLRTTSLPLRPGGFKQIFFFCFRGNFNYQQHFYFFSAASGPIMVKWVATAGQEQRLPPLTLTLVNLRAWSHARGAVTGRGRGGRSSRWYVSIRLLRGNAHIWRALYLLSAL